MAPKRPRKPRKRPPASPREVKEAVRCAIQALEAINDGAASVYAQRSGKSKAEVLELDC